MPGTTRRRRTAPARRSAERTSAGSYRRADEPRRSKGAREHNRLTKNSQWYFSGGSSRDKLGRKFKAHAERHARGEDTRNPFSSGYLKKDWTAAKKEAQKAATRTIRAKQQANAAKRRKAKSTRSAKKSKGRRKH